MRNLGAFSVLLIWVLVITFFSFIFSRAFSGLSLYGLRNIFWTLDFVNDPSTTDTRVSIISPLIITFFLTFMCAIFSFPIALRCAIWTIFSCPACLKRTFKFLFSLFSNIPPIILGLFAMDYLVYIPKYIFGMRNAFNVLTASIALVLMIMPMITTAFIAALENHRDVLDGSDVLGLNRNFAVYKILIPKIRKVFVGAVTVVVIRVFSESIMLSLILGAKHYTWREKTIFHTQYNSVSALISNVFFTDGSGENIQNLMFFFGSVLVALSLGFSSITMKQLAKKDDGYAVGSKLSLFDRYKSKVSWYLTSKITVDNGEYSSGSIGLLEFMVRRGLRSRIPRAYTGFRKSLEYLSIFIFLSYVVIFVFNNVFYGIKGLIYCQGANAAEIHLGDSLWRALLNTMLIIFISMFVSVSFAFYATFWLAFYGEKTKFGRWTISLMNSANASPSILYGMFGMSFFINTLGFTAKGTTGKSMLAGILTMIVLIIPLLTTKFYTYILQVPREYRLAAEALGLGKYEIYNRIMVNIAAINMIMSGLLTIGKILGETSLFFITAGINSTRSSSLLYQGQTLTTRIYSTFNNVNINDITNVIAETSFIAFLFLSAVIFSGVVLAPKCIFYWQNRDYYKQRFSLWLYFHRWRTKWFFRQIFKRDDEEEDDLD